MVCLIQRRQRVFRGSGDHHWDFGYNQRSELTGGERRTGSNPGQGTLLTSKGSFDYGHDLIGNRQTGTKKQTERGMRLPFPTDTSLARPWLERHHEYVTELTSQSTQVAGAGGIPDHRGWEAVGAWDTFTPRKIRK
ncbi:MAG: hypothetical protein GX616_16530 [Planctomycetes bacterium]|nr:hypothetical protein [Planctomycetota bacterium]